MQASNLAKHALPLPKELTQGDLQELAEDFDARVKAFRHVLEVRDPNAVLAGVEYRLSGVCGVSHGERDQGTEASGIVHGPDHKRRSEVNYA